MRHAAQCIVHSACYMLHVSRSPIFHSIFLGPHRSASAGRRRHSASQQLPLSISAWCDRTASPGLNSGGRENSTWPAAEWLLSRPPSVRPFACSLPPLISRTRRGSRPFLLCYCCPVPTAQCFPFASAAPSFRGSCFASSFPICWSWSTGHCTHSVTSFQPLGRNFYIIAIRVIIAYQIFYSLFFFSHFISFFILSVPSLTPTHL